MDKRCPLLKDALVCMRDKCAWFILDNCVIFYLGLETAKKQAFFFDKYMKVKED